MVAAGPAFQASTQPIPENSKNCWFLELEAMFRKFVNLADRFFLLAHVALWAVVMIVWSLAWHQSHGPWWPRFGFAKLFLSRVDGVVSGGINAVSLPLAKAGESALGGDVGLWYTVIFAGLTLVGGTIQWFLVGRLLQLVAAKYGQPSAAIVAGCVAVYVTLAGVSWAMSW